MMIGHIFGKDLKLLWPAALGVALANVTERLMLSRADSLAVSNLVALNLFGFLALIATMTLIVVVVHQDPLPVLRDDWLVRPISRRDLLASKLLFVALVLQSPIFLAEIGQGLMAGLPFWRSVFMALSRSAWMLMAMSLPCLALAALTRNMVQAIGTALAIAFGFVLIFGIYLLHLRDNGGPYLRLSTIAWVGESVQTVWSVTAVAVVLTLQYRWRKTVRARWVFGAAALVWILVETVPVPTAFAVQERFSRDIGAASAVQIAFAPDLGLAAPAAPGVPNHPSERMRNGVRERAAFLSIPLKVSGVPEGSWLLADALTIRVADLSGRTVELDADASTPEFRDSSARQLITVQEAAYNLVKDQPERLEMDYSLTLMEPGATQTIPAVGGNKWISNLGLCTTSADSAGLQVYLHCVSPHSLPCMEWFLENARTGVRGPRATPLVTNWGYHGPTCWPDFSPYVAGIGGDPAARLDLVFPTGGVASGPQLPDVRLKAVVYQPAAHFKRRLVIPKIRLSEWRLQ
jgi:hypothetical protein